MFVPAGRASEDHAVTQASTDPPPLDYATRRAERSRKFWAGAVAFAALFFVVAVVAIFWVRSQTTRRQQLAAQVALQRNQQAQVAAALAAALQNNKQLQTQLQPVSPAAPATSNAVFRLPRVLAKRTETGVEIRLRNDHPAGDVLLDPADRVVVEHADRRQFLSPEDLMPADVSALAPGESGKAVTVRLPADARDVRIVYQHADPATNQRIETAIQPDAASPNPLP